MEHGQRHHDRGGREPGDRPSRAPGEDEKRSADEHAGEAVGHRAVADEGRLSARVERLEVVPVDRHVVGRRQDRHQQETDGERRERGAVVRDPGEREEHRGERDLGAHEPAALALVGVEKRPPEELQVPRQVEQRGEADRLQACAHLLEEDLGQVVDDAVGETLREVGARHPGAGGHSAPCIGGRFARACRDRLPGTDSATRRPHPAFLRHPHPRPS